MNKLARSLTSATAALALAATLSGCIGVAAVGVGAGALMATDRRLSEVYLADQAIEVRAGSRIGGKYDNKVHINATSFNRTLLLTGEVPDTETRDAIEKMAAELSDVKRISNELKVAPNSDLATRSNDLYLTTKVKTRFLDANIFQINLVKVVSESGTVYLLGLVTQREADAAVEIARTTGGVQRVVRIFEIISDAQARQLDITRPADNNDNAAGKK